MRLTYTSGDMSRASEQFDSALAQVRADAADPLPHLIGGEDAHEGDVLERRDPGRTEEVASRAHTAGGPLVERAVRAARDAAAEWRTTAWEERCTLMRRVAAGISERHLELAAVASLEAGKTRAESIAEIQEAVDLITTYAEVMEGNDGFVREMLSFSESERNTDVLRPYGVFGVIAPFNFPAALAVNMAGAALIAGNTVVLKPSEEAPWTGAILGEVSRAAGLPPGVLNVIQGGPDTGAALVQRVDGVAFTGSAEVGRAIARALQEGPYARPALTEMGGKNPAIVSARADLDKAAEGIARAAFGLSGQKCSACSRAIVDARVHDELLERLAAFTETLAVGDVGDADSFLGPVVNERSVARFETAVDAARAQGRVVAGGERPVSGGHYVAPTVVADLPLGHSLTRDELFLPFVAVTRVESFEEALAEANAVPYGLTAGVFTEDAGEQEQFLDEIEAGVVYVNRRAGATTGAWPGAQTFCGWKSSGSTGKGGLGPYYLPQFMREQSRTVATG